MNDPVLGMIGFARKSGNLVVGRSAVENARRRGDLHLVIIARDASEKLVRGLTGMSDAPVFRYGDKAQYMQLLNRDVAVLGITDRQFAAGVIKKLPPDALIATP